MDEIKPVWTSSSYLLYAGALTVLGAALGALAYLSANYGDAAYAAWSLLVFGVLVALADVFLRRGQRIAAGVFVFVGLVAWAAFLAAVWTWFGWLHSGSFDSLAGFSVARLSLLLLVLAAALHDRRKYGFPFVGLIVAVVFWIFTLDLVSSGAGTWGRVVTLLVGLAYLAAGSGSDRPSAFWLHLVGGVLIGGVLLGWWHSSDTDWALVSAGALVYVLIAYATRRSSWAVLGTIGFTAATMHYLFGSITAGLPESPPSLNAWSPIVAFACLGFWFVLLGLLGRRREA
ncbi:MAG TPA: hypothetical protein VFJ91_07655 [Gaiellaceae bacterium]|nr:hypothetical protein [Gaiellaceae bacterium]